MTLDEFAELDKVYPKDIEALKKEYDDMEIVDYFMDHGIFFNCPEDALLEARIRQREGGDDLKGYPSADIGDFEGKTCVLLESAYGFGKENEVFCTYVVME